MSPSRVPPWRVRDDRFLHQFAKEVARSDQSTTRPEAPEPGSPAGKQQAPPQAIPVQAEPAIPPGEQETSTGPPGPTPGTATAGPPPEYDILNCIGEGGMGVVYRARLRHTGRLVALKQIKAEKPRQDQVQRFYSEAAAVARLKHPNIAQLLHAGTHEGKPCLVMELVDGIPLAQKLSDRPEPLPAAARLMHQLALTVEYIHEQGVVHRDLKPENILLHQPGTGPGEYGLPKIVDFGLAKRLTSLSEASATVVDTVEFRPGTLGYMAPEQHDEKFGSIDSHTDIYALGVIFYRLLTGRHPFTGLPRNVIDKTLYETPTPPSALVPGVPRDLETICLKCLEKRPTDRFANARALAEELGRYLNNEDITTRRPGPFTKMTRWVGQHPITMMVVTAFLVFVLVVGVVVSSLLLNLFSLRAQSLANQAREAQHRETLAKRSLYNGTLIRANYLRTRDPVQTLRLLNDRQLAPPAFRDFTWGLHKLFCERTSLALGRHGKRVRSLSFASNRTRASPVGAPAQRDGNARELDLLASGSFSGTWKLWDVNKRKELATGTTGQGGAVFVALSSDGKRLVTGLQNGEIQLWDTQQQSKQILILGREVAVKGLALSSDDNHLGIGWTDGMVWLFDLSTRKKKVLFSPMLNKDKKVNTYGLAFSPDGRWFAVGTALVEKGGGMSGAVRLWDMREDRELPALTGAFRGAVRTLAFSPDGRTLAVAADEAALSLWDVTTRTQLHTRQAHEHEIISLAYSPDGKYLATGSGTETVAGELWGTVKLWDANTLQQRLMVPAHALNVRAVAFGPDSRVLVSGGDDGTLRMLDLTRKRGEQQLKAHDNRLTSLAFSPDAKLLASGSWDGDVKLWEVSTWKALGKLAGDPSEWVNAVVFHPDGKRLVTGSSDRVIRLWDVARRRSLGVLARHGETVKSLAISPDGSLLAVGGDDHKIALWDWNSRKVRARWDGHQAAVETLCFTPDGIHLVSGGGDGNIGVWEVTKGQLASTQKGHEGGVWKVAIHPEGNQLASAGHDGTVKLWSLPQLERLHTLKGHAGPVRCVAYTSDGKTLGSASALIGQPAQIKLWDPTSGAERTTLSTGHVEAIADLAFLPYAGASGSLNGSASAGGQRRTLWLATAGWDKYLGLWEAQNPE